MGETCSAPPLTARPRFWVRFRRCLAVRDDAEAAEPSDWEPALPRPTSHFTYRDSLFIGTDMSTCSTTSRAKRDSQKKSEFISVSGSARIRHPLKAATLTAFLAVRKQESESAKEADSPFATV